MELDTLERWIIIIAIIAIAGLINYKLRIKHIRLEKRIKSILNGDSTETHDISFALVNLHYGKYKQALSKLKFAHIEQPQRDDIKEAIIELQNYIDTK